MDSWSLGAILFVLLAGRNLFKEPPAPDAAADEEDAGEPPPPRQPTELEQLLLGAIDADDLSPEARDLILCLCRVNPQHRLTVFGALQHAYVLGCALAETPHPDTLSHAELLRRYRAGVSARR
jgi:serine/threonine protein kinase